MIDFSSIDHTSYLGKLLRLPLRLIPEQMVLPILQGELRGYRWVHGASTAGCWLGSFEVEKQRLFAEHLHRGAVTYDIGANVGFYTLLAAHVAGYDGQVHAFEPLASNLTFLRRHLELNRIRTATVHSKAVSDSVGTAFFQEGATRSTGRLAAKGKAVDTVTLDHLVSEQGLPLPDIVKIDVEGGETQVLKGGRTLLRETSPAIFLATHGEQVHRECVSILREFGYQLRALNNQEVMETDELFAWKD